MADIERKLATVRRIAAIDPIEGADKIVCVTVDGWKLVSAKENGFQVGDLVIYIEIDSFLPEIPEFEWLRKSSFKDAPGIGKGFRIKTIKLRGQVSQGLIVPLSDFFGPEDTTITIEHSSGHERDSSGDWVETIAIEEGTDLTEYLGIKKYEKPIPANMQGRTKGNFPSFIRKTDEERVQNCWGGVKRWIFQNRVTEVYDALPKDVIPFIFYDGASWYPEKDENQVETGKWIKTYYGNNDPDLVAERQVFEATLKLDGSSETIYHYNGQIGVCSRNLELKRDPENPFWKVAIETGILKHLIQEGGNIAVQGELMGPGVQGNREGFKNLSLWVFNIFDIDLQSYYTPRERQQWMDKMFNSGNLNDVNQLYHAPDLGMITLAEHTSVGDFLTMADKQKSVLHDICEGIVFKSTVPGGPSFKVISNKFLLKEND